MLVMCLNGWGGKLHDQLLSYVKLINPDVLCLQEVVHTPTAQHPVLMYRDGGFELHQRANFFLEVKESLPHHTAIFCPAAQGDLWDGEERLPSQWGLATFVRNNIAIIGQTQGFVHGAFSPYGYGDHPRSRNAHAMRLFDFKKGFAVTIAHMHGLRDLAGKQDTPARLLQAERLAAMISSVAHADDRVIACGDFNLLPDSQTFDTLRKIGLVDLVTTRGFTDTRTSHYAKAGRYADYMLVNSKVEVKHFDVVEAPEVSDHRPLLLEFQ
jgi:endonuclease/exonuclease/phosphatase family metal-dependent hydrolase